MTYEEGKYGNRLRWIYTTVWKDPDHRVIKTCVNVKQGEIKIYKFKIVIERKLAGNE